MKNAFSNYVIMAILGRWSISSRCQAGSWPHHWLFSSSFGLWKLFTGWQCFRRVYFCLGLQKSIASLVHSVNGCHVDSLFNQLAFILGYHIKSATGSFLHLCGAVCQKMISIFKLRFSHSKKNRLFFFQQSKLVLPGMVHVVKWWSVLWGISRLVHNTHVTVLVYLLSFKFL